MFDRNVLILCVILTVRGNGGILASFDPRSTNNDQTTACLKTVHLENIDQFANNISLDLSQNCIASVGPDPFFNFFDLTSLNLSRNVITEIRYIAFTSLIDLKQLDLSHNHLSDLFFDTNNLRKLKMLNASHNQIEVLDPTVFENFSSLEYLDLSYNAIRKIEQDAFSKITSLVYIDLSNNQIETLDVDMSKFIQVRHIFLNNNKITLKSGKEFANLKFLKTLSVENNDILELYTDSLPNSIEVLRLSSNRRLKIIGNSFESTSLRELALDSINSTFTFENRLPNLVSLEAHNCGLKNLSDINLYNIPSVSYLNLSYNEIPVIDRYSFPSLFRLEILDISFNQIGYIQPGSFIDTQELKTLKLGGNRLKRLQLGTFHGIRSLIELNLSNNEIYTIDAKMLPIVKNLLLDNNMLTHLNFYELVHIKDQVLTTLSIGGNPISCESLSRFKNSHDHYYDSKDIVTSSEPNYYTENIDGISCRNDRMSNVDFGLTVVAFMSNVSESLLNLNKSVQGITDNFKLITEIRSDLQNILRAVTDPYNYATAMNESSPKIE